MWSKDLTGNRPGVGFVFICGRGNWRKLPQGSHRREQGGIQTQNLAVVQQHWTLLPRLHGALCAWYNVIQCSMIKYDTIHLLSAWDNKWINDDIFLGLQVLQKLPAMSSTHNGRDGTVVLSSCNSQPAKCYSSSASMKIKTHSCCHFC